jgi:queuosine precursor transporter
MFVISCATIGALWLGKEALIGLICVEAVLVNLFVSKTILLFGLTATASDALAVGIALALNTLQEYYHKPLTQKAIAISFACALFYVVITLLHLAYIPAPTDSSNHYFQALLQPMPRIIFASLATYLLVQYLECYLYGTLCTLWQNRFFIIRNYTSVAVTQLLDTILFTFLGLYKLNESFSSWNTLLQIIVVSYTVKLLALSIGAPFLGFTKKFVPRRPEA